MTFHQGQDLRNEHGQIWHENDYRHTTFEWYSLNCVRDMAVMVQVKHVSSLRRNCDLEWRARSSDSNRLCRPLLGLSSWMISEIIEHLLFSWLRCVLPWMKVKVNIVNTWCITHVWGIHRAQFDDDDLNSFRGTACVTLMWTSRLTERPIIYLSIQHATDRQTHTHTNTNTNTHTHTYTHTHTHTQRHTQSHTHTHEKEGKFSRCVSFLLDSR